MLLLTYSTNKSYWIFASTTNIFIYDTFRENYGPSSRHYKIMSKNQQFFAQDYRICFCYIYRCSFVHRQNIHKNVLSKLPPINILTDMTRKLILFYMYLQVSKIKAYYIFDVFRTTSNNRNTFFVTSLWTNGSLVLLTAPEITSANNRRFYIFCL